MKGRKGKDVEGGKEVEGRAGGRKEGKERKGKEVERKGRERKLKEGS